MTIGNAHYIQLQATFLHQLFLLTSQLLQEAIAHRTRATNKEIEHLVFGQEERIVNHIQGFTQILFFHHERDVGFRSTLGTSDYTDTVSSQCTEQLTRNTRSLLHILAHNRNGRQVLFRTYGADFAHLDFLRELLVQHFASQFGILIPHTDGSTVFRRSLRHHKHADAVLGQCLEDAVVHTDDTHHTKTGHGNQGRIVDGRDTLDGLRFCLDFLLDDGTWSIGIEGILN